MKKIMLFLAVACIMAACNNDNKVLNEPQYITEFKAVFGGADSRIAAEASAAGLKFSWEDGDKLYVYDAEDENEYTDYKYNSATGKFEKVYDSDPGMTAGEYYFATTSNPSANSFTDVNGKFAIKTQLYDEGVTNIPLISELFMAQADGTIAPMHHTVGVVEVPVKLGEGSTITEKVDVAIEVAGANVVGPFITTLDEPYFANATGDNENYTSSSACQPATLNESTPVSFFIPMLPGTYTNPTLSFYNEEYTTQVAAPVELTGTSLTIECGKITKLQETVTLTSSSGPSSGEK